MARQLIEPGDTVHWDHVWGEEVVRKPKAWLATTTRPAHVPQVGQGLVSRYSKNRQDLMVVDRFGKRWRVPVEHARVLSKAPVQDSLFE